MRLSRRLPMVLLALVVLAVVSHSTLAGPALSLPEPKGFVNDYAGVLKADERAKIEEVAQNLEKATSAELAVAVVKTTAPSDVKSYAVALFEKWGVGKKGKDNGVLIVVSIEDRRVEVEVGYGLEPILTDAMVGRILDNELIPHFKQGEFGKGILAAASAMASVISKASQGSSIPAPAPAPRPLPFPPEISMPEIPVAGSLVAIAMVVVGLVIAFMGIRSSFARKCPVCNSRLIMRDKVITPATPFSSGLASRVYQCPRCGYCDEDEYMIPPIIMGPRRGGGGWSGGGFGGFGGSGGGGGFTGFGGGSSGGGGSGRSW